MASYNSCTACMIGNGLLYCAMGCTYVILSKMFILMHYICIHNAENAKVTTMTTVGKKIIVGTVSGEVVILNSEDMNILAACFWHKGEVEALLVIPEEVKPCICAEIPFEEPDDTNAQICMVTENKYNIPNIEPNAAMIASIGKGRISLNASKTSENHTHFLIWKS